MQPLGEILLLPPTKCNHAIMLFLALMFCHRKASATWNDAKDIHLRI